MFEWRFRITPEIIPQALLEAAFFADWGRVPRLTHTIVQGSDLIVRSHATGSGTIHVPMTHLPLGVIMESTESLLSRHEPYHLLKELARGSLGRFQRRLFDWQMLGYTQPKEHEYRLKNIAKRFSYAVVGNPSSPEVEKEFTDILDELALLTIDENRKFAEQSISWRTRKNERLSTIFGIGMNGRHFESPHGFGTYVDLLNNSFHAVMPMPTWRELEPLPGKFDWERLENQLITPFRFGFQIMLGPLISFSADALPDWLLQNISDGNYLGNRATLFVNSVAERYGHLAHSWVLANRFMFSSLPGVPQSLSIALVRMLAQRLRSQGIRTPIIVGINQPWGEYALQRTPEWGQVRIAEALVGCREIDAFLLEMDFGCGDYLSLPRNPMCVGSMIDQWSFIGKKIYVSLSIPSAGNPVSATSKLAPEMQWSDEKQKTWTEVLLLTLLGRRSVRGIIWSHIQDSAASSGFTPHHSGLLNVQQVIKPALKHFSAVRKNLLK